MIQETSDTVLLPFLVIDVEIRSFEKPGVLSDFVKFTTGGSVFQDELFVYQGELI